MPLKSISQSKRKYVIFLWFYFFLETFLSIIIIIIFFLTFFLWYIYNWKTTANFKMFYYLGKSKVLKIFW